MHTESSKILSVNCVTPIKKSHLTPKERAAETKGYIFHWNVASTRFDSVCTTLNNEIYHKEIGSGNYHVGTKGIIFQVTDLETKQSLLPPEIFWGAWGAGSVPHVSGSIQPKKHRKVVDMPLKIMEEPFSYLRPSITFGMFGGKSDPIPIEDILEDIESKLASIDVK